jgi:hypothetical protein
VQYTQPYGVTDPNASFVNGNPATGQQGSIIPAAAVEAPQREIVNVITAAGLTPSPSNNTQLLAALQIATNFTGVDTGTRNAMVVNLGPGFALAKFARITVQALNTVTGPATVQVSTNSVLVGTYNLTRTDGSALNPYDLVAEEIFTAQFDGTKFQVQKALTGQTGDVKPTGAAASQPGWLPLNGLTIGSPLSSATGRANNDCLQLFEFVWTNYDNSICPVSGGRTASAAADWVANKTIALPDWQCKAPIGVDAMGGAPATGRLTGVPVTAGSAATPGSTLGEALHTLSVGELPTHTPGGSISTVTPSGTIGGSYTVPNGVEESVTPSGTGGMSASNQISAETLTVPGSAFTFTGNPVTPSFTGNPIGSNSAHNNTALSVTAVWLMRL